MPLNVPSTKPFFSWFWWRFACLCKVWKAACATWLSSVGKHMTSDVVLRDFAFDRHPAHKRHLFKLQPRQRGGESYRADRTRSHTPEQKRRVQHADRARGRGSFSVFFFPHLHEHSRKPPRQGLKMRTEVGKLVLLHLLLAELHCAKGKTLVSASPRRSATLWGSPSVENRLVSVRDDALCATAAHTWISRFSPQEVTMRGRIDPHNPTTRVQTQWVDVEAEGGKKKAVVKWTQNALDCSRCAFKQIFVFKWQQYWAVRFAPKLIHAYRPKSP